MNVQSISRSLSDLETPWLALGIFEDATEPPLAVRDLALSRFDWPPPGLEGPGRWPR